MLNNTLERLRAMKMSAFADELERQTEDAENYNQLGFEDRLSLLVDCEWNRRQNNKLLRYIRNAHFSDSSATMEGVEYIERTGIWTRAGCCGLQRAGMLMSGGTLS